MAVKKKKGKKVKPGSIRVDFSGVEAGGGRPRYPEGDYVAEITAVGKRETAGDNDTPFIPITFTLESENKKVNGKEIKDRFFITPKSLWRLKKLLEAAGLTVPDGAMDIPIKELKGAKVGLTIVDDDPYKGRVSSKIADVIDPDMIGDEDEEDEDEDEDEDEEEEEDEDDDEELEEVDLDEEM
jgi:hypothetical protein